MLSRLGVGAAGIGFGAGFASYYWQMELDAARNISEKSLKYERRMKMEAISSIVSSLEVSNNAIRKSVLQNPLPEVTAEMKQVYPFEHLPPNPGVIRHVVEGNYIIGYDAYLHSPRWVIERITAESVQGSASRRGVQFFADKNLPKHMRVSSRYFERPFSRGHMASAGAHKDSQQALESTFVMSNIIVQDGCNNASDWLRLELWSRHLAKEYGEVIVLNTVGSEIKLEPPPSYSTTERKQDAKISSRLTEKGGDSISEPKKIEIAPSDGVHRANGLERNKEAKERKSTRGHHKIDVLNHYGVWTHIPQLILKAVCVPNGIDGNGAYPREMNDA
eukprot:jgi/Bigna1/71874/fgenesh1_pg.17_\